MISDKQNTTVKQNDTDDILAGQQSEQTVFEAMRPREKQEPDSKEYGTELKYRSAANVGAGKLAKGLGWFSIGLGLAELLAPGQIGDLIGLDDRHRAFLPVLGLREIARLRMASPFSTSRNRPNQFGRALPATR